MKAKRLFKTRQPSNLGYAPLRKQLSNFQLSDLQHLQTALLSTWERPSTEDSTFIDSIGLPTVSVAFLSESVPQSTRLLVDDSPEIYWMPSLKYRSLPVFQQQWHIQPTIFYPESLLFSQHSYPKAETKEVAI